MDNHTDEQMMQLMNKEHQRLEAIENRKSLEKKMKNAWGYSDVALESKAAAMTMLSTKTGMYARVPLICKADSCPYADTCYLLDNGLAPYGEYCAIETEQIDMRVKGYAEDFDLDSASFTDKCLIGELINLDIIIERCKGLMNNEQSPVVDVVISVTENGDEVIAPAISKSFEAYEKASRRKETILNLMSATRKDKKGEIDEKSLFSAMLEEISNKDTSDYIIPEMPEHLKYELMKNSEDITEINENEGVD